MIKKERKSNFWMILAIIFFLGYVIMCCMVISLRLELNQQKEYSSVLCELTNVQSDLVKDLYPYFSDSSCDAIKGLINNTNSSNYLCTTLKNLKMPDKLDCSKI